MSQKAECPVCGSYTSAIYDSGICSMGCQGRHAFKEGGYGFCEVCRSRRDSKVHRAEFDMAELDEIREKARDAEWEAQDAKERLERLLASITQDVIPWQERQPA